MATTVRILLGAAMLIAVIPSAGAAESCCANCGTTDGLRRVCRAIRTTKHIEYTVWDSVCEEFCLPLSASHAPEQRYQVRSRNKLMKKTLVSEVPVVKWVVDYVCDQCQSQLTLAEHELPSAANDAEANPVGRPAGAAFHDGDRTMILGGLLVDQLIAHGFVAARSKSIPAR